MGLQVIPGIEAAVKSMRVGGLRRVIIPPSQGYQNTSQEPIPPNVTFVPSEFQSFPFIVLFPCSFGVSPILQFLLSNLLDSVACVMHSDMRSPRRLSLIYYPHAYRCA